MSDIESNFPGELNMRAPVSLGDALRALPQLAPEASAWPALAAKLAAAPASTSGAHLEHRTASAPRRAAGVRRFALPAALAAGAMLAFIATAPLRTPGARTAVVVQTPATNPVAAASSVHNVANDTNTGTANRQDGEGLDALQSRSHTLERWLRDTGAASAPKSAQDLAASAELEDMIGLVDVQLSGVDENASLPLWQRRVSLLEDLAMLRYGANLNQFKSGTATAANNPGDARSAVW
ncbi:MAG: hypothetical protein E6K53_09715 [Gammaproteobacteria bacterium]|nr:MAG: hypothetical protein E6K53_09715 [Gammaproteobacteria bacterium]